MCRMQELQDIVIERLASRYDRDVHQARFRLHIKPCKHMSLSLTVGYLDHQKAPSQVLS